VFERQRCPTEEVGTETSRSGDSTESLWRRSLFILACRYEISRLSESTARMVNLRGFTGQPMSKLARNFELLAVPMGRFASRCIFLFRPFVFIFLVLVGGSAAIRADASNPPTVSIGPGPQYAISDFDGDRQPDTASIQAAPSGPGHTDYWIRLELSASGRQLIRLAAPAGGLQIEARDVNGDHAVDLVLTTAWFRQPVAILLNDGHGGFSRVEPSAFPREFSESTTNWFSVINLAMDAVGLPPQSGAWICSQARVPTRFRRHTGSAAPLSAGFLASPYLMSHAGRAPPSEVYYL